MDLPSSPSIRLAQAPPLQTNQRSLTSKHACKHISKTCPLVTGNQHLEWQSLNQNLFAMLRSRVKCFPTLTNAITGVSYIGASRNCAPNCYFPCLCASSIPSISQDMRELTILPCTFKHTFTYSWKPNSAIFRSDPSNCNSVTWIWDSRLTPHWVGRRVWHKKFVGRKESSGGRCRQKLAVVWPTATTEVWYGRRNREWLGQVQTVCQSWWRSLEDRGRGHLSSPSLQCRPVFDGNWRGIWRLGLEPSILRRYCRGHGMCSFLLLREVNTCNWLLWYGVYFCCKEHRLTKRCSFIITVSIRCKSIPIGCRYLYTRTENFSNCYFCNRSGVAII